MKLKPNSETSSSGFMERRLIIRSAWRQRRLSKAF